MERAKMLELYHSWPCGHSAIALIGLHEKGLHFESHYVELRNLEQYSPQFLTVNPHGHVPVLRHAGASIAGTTELLEYIEETFPTPVLMPADAVGRWKAHVWAKILNEDIAPSVALLGWHTWTLPTLGIAERATLQARVSTIPIDERRALWQLALGETEFAEHSQYAIYKLGVAVSRVEAALAQHPWLAGAQYSLADIYLFPMLVVLPRLLPQVVNAPATPRLLAWLNAVRDRPGVRSALSFKPAGAQLPADSLEMFVPGPEPIRWG
jgi:glutathione S-transferase